MLKDVLDQLGSLTLRGEEGRGGDRQGARYPGRGQPRRVPALRVRVVRAQGPELRRLAALALQGCGSTSSAKTMSLLACSKLAPEVWSDYVSDMLSGASLRACAELCGVSLKTSWFMLLMFTEKWSFCSVQLDKTRGRLSREAPPLVGQTVRARCFQGAQRRQGLGGLDLSYPGPLLRVPRQVAAPVTPGGLPRESLDVGQPDLPPAGRHPAAARNAVGAGGGSLAARAVHTGGARRRCQTACRSTTPRHKPAHRTGRVRG